MILASDLLLPFPFTNVYRTSSQRHPTRHLSRIGFVQASLTEVSADDAPVAMTWVLAQPYRAPVQHQVRFFRGAFYMQPHCLEDPNRVRAFFSDAVVMKRDIADIAMQQRSVPGQVLLHRGVARDGNAPYLRAFLNEHAPRDPLVPSDVVALASSDEDAARRRMEALAADLLVVGRQEVWIRVGEPRLILSQSPEGLSAEVFVGATSFGDEIPVGMGGTLGMPPEHMFFGLADTEGLHAELLSRGVDRAARRMPRDFTNVFVTMPEAFTTDWAAEGRRRVVEGFVRLFSDDIAERPAAAIGHWLAARDALGAFSAGDARGLDLAVEENMPAFLDGFSAVSEGRVDRVRAALLSLGGQLHGPAVTRGADPR